MAVDERGQYTFFSGRLTFWSVEQRIRIAGSGVLSLRRSQRGHRRQRIARLDVATVSWWMPSLGLVASEVFSRVEGIAVPCLSGYQAMQHRIFGELGLV